MTGYSAHLDSFARDNLPPRSEWPDFLLNPPFNYPERLNCAVELLDRMAEGPRGERPLFHSPAGSWTYAEMLAQANRIAHVLVEDFGLVPGNRVLIRAANNPMFIACWFAIAKAGGIVVATMPLLRGKEIATIIDRAQVTLALCDTRLAAEMEEAARLAPVCRRVCFFDGSVKDGAATELERRMAGKPDSFTNADTAADDTVLIAFTSGTTGKPKGTMHFHRDVMSICDAFPRSVLKPNADDVFIGSPPIAFTFGLGGLATFPMRAGASSVLLEKATPDALLEAIGKFGATICFTAPTAWRAMLGKLDGADIRSLRKCVSAGETLPKPTFDDWKARTGLPIIDGIGATEMLHIFISAPEEEIRPGATGKPLPGYEAMVVDDDFKPLPAGEVGRLAVRGPTGCRYLDDPRQRNYVRDGWNLTGDAYRMDEDGYFWFQARADDMIISAGYNISGPEVEEALMAHADVAECAVVGAPDASRGNIVKAFVVLKPGVTANEDKVKSLQDFVKATIAPYKYPRAIEFVSELPKTETNKIQRFKLRQSELEKTGGTV